MHCMNFFYASNLYVMSINALKVLGISKLPAQKKKKNYKLVFPLTVLLNDISLHIHQPWYDDYSSLLV